MRGCDRRRVRSRVQGHDPGCKKKARMFSGVVLLAGSYLTTGPHSRPGRLDCAGNRTRGCSDRLDLIFEAKFWVHICQREGPQPKGLWKFGIFARVHFAPQAVSDSQHHVDDMGAIRTRNQRDTKRRRSGLGFWVRTQGGREPHNSRDSESRRRRVPSGYQVGFFAAQVENASHPTQAGAHAHTHAHTLTLCSLVPHEHARTHVLDARRIHPQPSFVRDDGDADDATHHQARGCVLLPEARAQRTRKRGAPAGRR